jgi:hypothetical protein
VQAQRRRQAIGNRFSSGYLDTLDKRGDTDPSNHLGGGNKTHVANDKGISQSRTVDLVTKKRGGRFKNNFALLVTAIAEDGAPPSTSTPPGASSIPSWEHKASFFQVHSHPGASPSALFATEASQSVSTESTASFAHGDEASSQRDLTNPNPASGGYFRVHTAADRSISYKRAVANPKSLVNTETRVRPIPSSDLSQYAIVTDHRSAGDSKDPNRTRSSVFEPSSLVQTEGRSRPVASTTLPEYAKHFNHRSAGDSRDTKRSARQLSSITRNSLVDIETRARPIASTKLPQYEQVSDRGGDTKVTSYRATISLADTETRARPIPSSKTLPEYTKIKDRRSVGDDHTLTKNRNSKLPLFVSSLITKEQRTRPAPSSSDQSHNKISWNYRGPGDDNAITKRAKKHGSAPTVSSLSAAEQRTRPVPMSSGGFQSILSGDHRGANKSWVLFICISSLFPN